MSESLAPWSELDGDEMAAAVQGLLDGYKREQDGRRNNYIRNLESFEGRSLGGYTSHSYYAGGADDGVVHQRDRLRLIHSAVATAVSTIFAPQKPKPQFQTLGATWEIRRKAYRLDRICEGLLNQRQGRFINMWAFVMDNATDVALQGDGPVKVIADTVRKRICHKQIPAVDLFCDPAEQRDPQNLFQREPIDAAYAKEKWSKHSAKIESAQPYQWYTTLTIPRASKVVELQYAWRLPISKEKPGKWCACINGALLESGGWTAPAFPFVFHQWEPHRDGFWASGIADEARKLAEDCSEIDMRLFHREILASVKRIYYPREKVNPLDFELNDATVAIGYEGGQPPVESVTPAFTPQDVEYLRLKISHFWDAIGISQVSAAARREPGIESGRAQMVLNDTKAGRQLLKAQRYEQAYVDYAHQWIWRMRELAEADKSVTVRWAGKTMMRLEKWSDADVEDEMFTVAVAPSSMMPHDPAGRQEMVSTVFEAGLISKETARTLIGWPDLDSELSIQNSEYEYVDMLIEKFLDANQDTWSESDYVAPEGFMLNKVGALRRFIAAWFRARIDQQSLPKKEQAKAEFSIGLLANYIKALQLKITPPEQAAAAEGPALMGAAATPPGSPVQPFIPNPGGPPGAPPVPGAGPIAA